MVQNLFDTLNFKSYLEFQAIIFPSTLPKGMEKNIVLIFIGEIFIFFYLVSSSWFDFF